VTHFIGLLLAGVCIAHGESHRWLFFITMAVLGVGDAGLNTQLYALFGSYYPRDPDAAFACMLLNATNRLA
jgi:phosphoglycerol transferase MdoB-like AlkP superfamily enzyme